MEPEAQVPITFDSLHNAVERILTDYHENAVVIERTTLLTDPERRNRAWRCHLQATTERVPETVIIKQVSPEGYDPANVESWDTSRFFNDWAGAQFLSEVAPAERHGPAFYGGNIALGFIVLEDLGEHTSLVKPLLEGDAISAHVALVALARRLGAMHASAMGKEEQYRTIRHNLSPEWVLKGSNLRRLSRRRERSRLPTLLSTVRDWGSKSVSLHGRSCLRPCCGSMSQGRF